MPFETTDGCFRWSGLNTHAGRVTAGRELAEYVTELYRLGAQVVDIVAHSHGGNVVKEASNLVAFRRAVFLGTPHFYYPDDSGVPYQLNPAGVEQALNVFCENDSVQVKAAQAAPDFGGPPSMPQIGSFAGSLDPVRADRVDHDARASSLYTDVRVTVDAPPGKKTHSALCSAEIGYEVGTWLAG